MSSVEFEDGAIRIDAGIVAEGFGLEPEQLRQLLRAARITTRHERGVDEDAGRHRITFLYGRRRLRLMVDGTGTIIERSHTDSDEAD
jgi:hypothetical protein